MARSPDLATPATEGLLIVIGEVERDRVLAGHRARGAYLTSLTGGGVKAPSRTSCFGEYRRITNVAPWWLPQKREIDRLAG